MWPLLRYGVTRFRVEDPHFDGPLSRNLHDSPLIFNSDFALALDLATKALLSSSLLLICLLKYPRLRLHIKPNRFARTTAPFVFQRLALVNSKKETCILTGIITLTPIINLWVKV